MAKIPVGATIAHAYRFAFHDFLRILGVMWLPVLLAWGSALTLHQFFPDSTPPWATLGLAFLQFFLMLMQLVGLAHLALGLHQGPVWIYFSFAKPIWRLIGSVLLLALVLMLAAIGAFVGSRLLIGLQHIVSSTASSPWLSVPMHLLVFLAILAVWSALIYLYIRLYFLLLPVIATGEPEFALARSWQLGRGNFWRMILLMLTLLIPITLIEGAAIFFWLLHGIPFVGAHAQPEVRTAIQAAVQARITAFTQDWYRYWYISFPLSLVAMSAIYGYLVGVHCFAHRALTSEPVAGD